MGGVLIAGMGLPGSGKSSVFGALADRLCRQAISATVYREPEETEWTDAVHNRSQCGHITALTWFRSIRVPMLYQADQDRRDGIVALVDTYYDKLIHLYLDKPEFNWLMSREDTYRPVYADLAKLDFENLPNVDCLVTFRIDESRWKELVTGRGRVLDRNSKILDSFAMQPILLDAAETFCASKNIPHVIFENNQHSLAAAAEDLYGELLRLGVVK